MSLKKIPWRDYMRFHVVAAFLVVLSVLVLAPVRLDGISLTSHEPIRITSNSEFTSANGVVSGAGTLDDPYIIEGWEITEAVVGVDYGIWLENTDAYVVIRNCLIIPPYTGIRLEHVANVFIENVTVRGGHQGIYIYDSAGITILNSDISHVVGDAIFLFSSSDVKVVNCLIGEGRYHSLYMEKIRDAKVEDCDIYGSLYGIYAEGSERVLIRNCNVHNNLGDGIYFYVVINGTISNCQVHFNEEHGIYLDSSDWITVEYCDIRNSSLGIWLNPAFNCEIHHNNFINIYSNAQDDGQQNNWDKNYWSNYHGVDANNDGYGDSPYQIPGSANAKDNKPLMQIIPESPHIVMLALMMVALSILMAEKINMKNKPCK
ncbi:MAG: right-handed parallel beta-helix repeat-containing protein [Candidatus Bathyarchaeia archaeon]|nr:right-handed parallel beta-helix repeat-containing protein [Candidatus Bathyarchaeota archaeon]